MDHIKVCTTKLSTFKNDIDSRKKTTKMQEIVEVVGNVEPLVNKATEMVLVISEAKTAKDAHVKAIAAYKKAVVEAEKASAAWKKAEEDGAGPAIVEEAPVEPVAPVPPSEEVLNGAVES